MQPEVATVYPRTDAWRPGYCVVHLIAVFGFDTEMG